MRLDGKKKIKRLVIYFFYDADGIVDRYVPYMLEDINRNCSELFVIVNGKLTKEGRETFLKLTPNLMVRENVGFDVWAYKTALEHYGWDKLAEYDEVIMMNHTIMGPIYPFSEMFEEMNKRDLDFWGITEHHKIAFDPFGTVSYGYVPEHIQSHFIAVRKLMLKSLEFKNYWETRPKIESYNDAIGKHEAIFTKFFGDAGFVWECYVDAEELKDYTTYPLTMMPRELLEKYRCPIIKRRSFFHDYNEFLLSSLGNQGKEIIDYLTNNTDYDVGMIWENILRSCHMADIHKCMNLSFVLPKEAVQKKSAVHKVALVIHEYFDDLIDYCFKYALSMPEESDIFITTNSEKKKEAIEEIFSKGPWNKVTVLAIPNRGRDVSALLVGVAEYLDSYDYVCFVHDKKVLQLDCGIKGYSFSERCFQNVLGSKEFVQNVISLFEDEPYLGMLCPPPPNHADYFPTLGFEWGPNYEITKKLYDELELSVPISNSKEPIAPLGTMFWFRTKALKKLIQKGWTYKDFPAEPIASDGTALHAVERIYPFVVQDAGYYCAWLLSDYFARTEINNIAFMMRSIDIRAFQIYGLNCHYGLICTMDYSMSNDPAAKKKARRTNTKLKMKMIIPQPIWKVLRRVYIFFGGKKWLG